MEGWNESSVGKLTYQWLEKTDIHMDMVKATGTEIEAK